MKNLKKWNWTIFLVIMLVSNIGALANKNIDSIYHALIIGNSFGLIIGLAFAYITRED